MKLVEIAVVHILEITMSCPKTALQIPTAIYNRYRYGVKRCQNYVQKLTEVDENLSGSRSRSSAEIQR